MTIEEFNKTEHGAVMAQGVLPNSPDGIFMTRGGGNLKWIAKKGHGNDWAIYCHWDYQTDEFVLQSGDKITDRRNILKCVPCAPGLLNLYRL